MSDHALVAGSSLPVFWRPLAWSVACWLLLLVLPTLLLFGLTPSVDLQTSQLWFGPLLAAIVQYSVFAAMLAILFGCQSQIRLRPLIVAWLTGLAMLATSCLLGIGIVSWSTPHVEFGRFVIATLAVAAYLGVGFSVTLAVGAGICICLSSFSGRMLSLRNEENAGPLSIKQFWNRLALGAGLVIAPLILATTLPTLVPTPWGIAELVMVLTLLAVVLGLFLTLPMSAVWLFEWNRPISICLAFLAFGWILIIACLTIYLANSIWLLSNLTWDISIMCTAFFVVNAVVLQAGFFWPLMTRGLRLNSYSIEAKDAALSDVDGFRVLVSSSILAGIFLVLAPTLLAYLLVQLGAIWDRDYAIGSILGQVGILIGFLAISAVWAGREGKAFSIRFAAASLAAALLLLLCGWCLGLAWIAISGWLGGFSEFGELALQLAASIPWITAGIVVYLSASLGTLRLLQIFTRRIISHETEICRTSSEWNRQLFYVAGLLLIPLALCQLYSLLFGGVAPLMSNVLGIYLLAGVGMLVVFPTALAILAVRAARLPITLAVVAILYLLVSGLALFLASLRVSGFEWPVFTVMTLFIGGAAAGPPIRFLLWARKAGYRLTRVRIEYPTDAAEEEIDPLA